MAGRRVDEVSDNPFHVSSRLASTWGGNLTDMVRARRILEVIESEGLIERAAEMGKHFQSELAAVAERHSVVTDVRGRGLLCALTLPTTQLRDTVITRLREDEHVLVPASGPTTVQFRPALTVSADELSHGAAALDRVLTALA